MAEAMMVKTPIRLPLTERFVGAGVYALYYIGNFPLYADVVKHNIENKFKWPLYVGKAVPEGSRRGGFGLGASPGTVLRKRIREHETSIAEASNLDLADFYCRYLAVEDIWIPLGESLLIQMLQPVWNRVLDGFGIHKPGENRGRQACSLWDTVHPGRSVAAGLHSNPLMADAVSNTVTKFISTHSLNRPFD